jgi:mannosyltransferase
VALAAVLRFWRIDHQSYWLDEAFTARIVRGDFGAMLDGVRHSESTPPLYYALAWLWEHVFGWHEAGLRSLSALFGVATVPAAYAAARTAFASERAGLIAAALFAVNPYLVWYSQEARAYALLVLLCTLALTYFLNACKPRHGVRPHESPRLKGSDPGYDPGYLGSAYAKWGITAGLALATHYFAVFLVVPMAAWLLWRRRSRAVWLASAIPAAAALALLPLALEQRDAGHTLFIGEIPLGERLWSFPKKLATGELGTPTPGIGIAIGLALAAGAVLALRGSTRRAAALLLGLTAASVAAALALKLAGLDYFFPRNLIEVFVPFLVAVAGGFAAVRLGPAIAAAVALAGTALVMQVSFNASLQRDDWRGLVRALGPPAGTRTIVLSPEVGKTPLRLYAGRLTRIGVHGVHAAEIDIVANARPPRYVTPRPPAGFRIIELRTTPSWQLIRYRAPAPHLVGPHLLGEMRVDRERAAAVLVQRPG